MTERPNQPNRAADKNLRVIKSEDLLQGQRIVHIEHAGQVYKLKHTQQGKLVMTK